MRKLILAGVVGVVSTVAGANKPLMLQQGEPAPMGNPVQYQAPKKSYSSSASSALGDYVSFNAAYSGSKIGTENLGGDSKLNGIDLGFVGVRDNLSAGVGLTYQGDNDWNYTEIYSKFGYRLFNQNNNYGIASIGTGYAWMSAKDFPIDLEYFVIPVELEVGHYIQNNLAVFGALGYKWLWNTVTEVCVSNVCGSDSLAEMDVDGATYKVGLRYNF